MVIPASRKLDFREVPMVDIGALGGADDAAVIREIARVCQDVGFMYVCNHGVPQSVLDDLVAQAKLFFDLPVREKMSAAVEKSPQFRGYLPLEYTGDEGPEGRNLQEGFMIMQDRPLGTVPLHGPNQWPQALPSLRAPMMRYFVELEKLARRMLPGFAAALGLAADFFAPFHDQAMTTLKLNHYPPQPAMTEGEMIGVGGHCDGGSFTILWQDDLGGLEIRNRSGEWVGVPPVEGAFVVNIGNMLQLWTNGRFSSTEHRVINRYGKDRNSIAFFVNPNYSAQIRPVIDVAAANVAAIDYGQRLQVNYRRIYPQRNEAWVSGGSSAAQ